MASGPAVSVVLPTRDRRKVLRRAVASVLEQGWRNLELIVVDDASAEPAAETLANFADARLRHLRLERNVGPAAARNRGLELARGHWVAFQDSDDVWEPEKLELQLAVLARQHDPVDLVYSDMIRVEADGATTPHRSPEVGGPELIDPATGFYTSYMIGIQTAVVRRALLESVGGFDERLRSLVDLDLFQRLARSCRFERIARPLVRYHATGGSVASDGAVEIASRRYLLEKYRGTLLVESPDFVVREEETLRRLAADPTYRERTTRA